MKAKKPKPKPKVEEPKVNIRDIIANQLYKQGLIVDVDSFPDGSGSWVDVRKTMEVRDLKRHLLTLSFNNDGTEITNVSCYLEQFSLSDDGTTRIV